MGNEWGSGISLGVDTGLHVEIGAVGLVFGLVQDYGESVEQWAYCGD